MTQDDYVLGRSVGDSVRLAKTFYFSLTKVLFLDLLSNTRLPISYRVLIAHRLDTEHLLWKLHGSYELHLDIVVTENMKIAELGTGTA